MTTKEKIETLHEIRNWLIKRNRYICEHYAYAKGFKIGILGTPSGRNKVKDSLKTNIPELYNMIMTTGNELNKGYKWGDAWLDEDEAEEYKLEEENNDFRIEKINELITTLENG